jgi:hypothetical protein
MRSPELSERLQLAETPVCARVRLGVESIDRRRESSFAAARYAGVKAGRKVGQWRRLKRRPLEGCSGVLALTSMLM